MGIKVLFILLSFVVLSTFVNGEEVDDDEHSSRQNVHSGHGSLVEDDASNSRIYPFQVALDVFKGPDKYSCGGSLISNRWVLTAAHCVDMNPDHIDVTLGAYNLYDVSSLLTLHTTQFIVHEGWDPDRHQNDVALIKLPFNVTFTEFVQPVELDRGGHDNRRRMATVISWGETQIRSSGLTRIDQIILSNKRCASASDFYEKLVTPKHMCTWGRGYKGICRGNSGGPLLSGGIQIGVFSLAMGNCSEGMPSVYMRVSEFSNWISEHTWDDYYAAERPILNILVISFIIFFCLLVGIIMERNIITLWRYYR